MTDAQTQAVYAAKVRDYAELTRQAEPDATLAAFIGDMPSGARVLDLGCGPAQASVFMRDAGLRPDPVDAAPEMVALANETHDIRARVATFDDVTEVGVYAGVWANFSLLHAPREDLPRHLSAIHRAMLPEGQLHIGMKVGTDTHRDDLGRRYTFVTVDELRGLLETAGFAVTHVREGQEQGLSGTIDPFLVMRGTRNA